jgi:hypothetical protein
MANIDYTVLPTGGAVQLTLSSAASGMTLNRATSGSAGLSAWTTLYNGPTVPLYLDTGDLLPGPLVPTEQYVYELTDTANNTFTTDAISVSGSLIINRLNMTELLQKLLWGGIQSLPLPSNYKKPIVYHAMPLTGQPPLPLITINLDLFQQQGNEIPIGQNIPRYDITGSWNVEAMAKWRYIVAVLTTSAQEREFYRDAIISLFHSILYAPMNALGKNISHSFQSTNGQISGDRDNPGFYWSEIALEMTGTFSVEIDNNPGLVNNIDLFVDAQLAGYNDVVIVSGTVS